MKNINNLVPDIYAVLDGKTKVTEGDTKELSELLASTISQKLSHGDQKGELRMSNFGTPCKRKLWYTVNLPGAAEPLQPWARFKFLYGDILETLVLWLAKKAGHKVEGEQDELVLEGIKGHRDAIIDGVTVDVKSANSRGMHKFKDHTLERDDPFGYLDQLSLYAHASRDDERVAVKREAAFLAVDKELGHLVLDKYKVKEITDEEIDDRKRMVSSDDPPRRHYTPESDGASGNTKLPVACSYCQFKKECWKNSNGGKGLMGYLYSTGPRWLTHVAREPNVPKLDE